MNNLFNPLIKRFTEKPKLLFLIDSIGAMMTAFSLYAVMRPLNAYIGMPKAVLTNLSVIAFCFCIYSFSCYLFVKKHWPPYIRIIGVANLLYCALTGILLTIHFPQLTIIGAIYFLIEIVVICGLVYVELVVAKAIAKKKRIV